MSLRDEFWKVLKSRGFSPGEDIDRLLAVLRDGKWFDGAVERIERTLFAVLPPEVLPTLRTKLAEGLLRAAVGEETL